MTNVLLRQAAFSFTGLLLLAGCSRQARPSDNAAPSAVPALQRLGRLETDSQRAGRPVVRVDLRDTRTGDADLVHLKEFHALTALDLGLTRITDDGLAHLSGLTTIEVLNLRLTRISDRGLVHLKGLKALRILDLSLTDVGDAGLAHLRDLANLETLYLGPKVSGEGLQHLGALAKLHSVYLDATLLSGAGLQRLKQGVHVPPMRAGFGSIASNGKQASAGQGDAKSPTFSHRTGGGLDAGKAGPGASPNGEMHGKDGAGAPKDSAAPKDSDASLSEKSAAKGAGTAQRSNSRAAAKGARGARNTSSSTNPASPRSGAGSK